MGVLLFFFCSIVCGMSVVSASERIQHPFIVDNLISNSDQNIEGDFAVKGKSFLNGGFSLSNSVIMGSVEINNKDENLGAGLRTVSPMLKIVFPENSIKEQQKYIGYLTVTFCADTTSSHQMFKSKYLFYYSNSYVSIKRIKKSYFNNIVEDSEYINYDIFFDDPELFSELNNYYSGGVIDELAFSMDYDEKYKSLWFDRVNNAILIPFITPESNKLFSIVVHYKIQLAGRLGCDGGDKILNLGDITVLPGIEAEPEEAP